MRLARMYVCVAVCARSSTLARSRQYDCVMEPMTESPLARPGMVKRQHPRTARKYPACWAGEAASGRSHPPACARRVHTRPDRASTVKLRSTSGCTLEKRP